MAQPSCFYEVQDGEQTLTIRIQKMDPLSAEDFLERLFAALVKAGFKVPAAFIGGDPTVLGREIAKNAEGILVQLKDLEFSEVTYLRQQLFKRCWIRKIDEKTGKEVELVMSDQNVIANITEVTTIFKIRLEVLKFNFGFLVDAFQAAGKAAKDQLNLQDTQTSVPSSESSSATESESGS